MSSKDQKAAKSGIQTSADGTAFIPSSTRADGSKRKEIRVRPGYRPPEDVETYKNRSAEAWKTRGSTGVPGTEPTETTGDSAESKSKNAKRREAAKRKQANASADGELISSMGRVDLSNEEAPDQEPNGSKQSSAEASKTDEAEVERQKKTRNLLKKFRAVKDLKEKKVAGEKLSPDQLMKISKEDEILRDLKKLRYEGPELQEAESEASTANVTATGGTKG